MLPGDGESNYVHYEDDGTSQAYAKEFATTAVSKTSSAESCCVKIGAREGAYAGMDAKRRIQVLLEGVFCPSEVKVDGRLVAYCAFPDDKPVEASWTYVGKDLAVVVTLPEADAAQAVSIECRYDVKALADAAGVDAASVNCQLLRGKKGIFHRMMRMTPVLKDVFNSCIDPYKLLSRPFLKLAQGASHIDAQPQMMVKFLSNIDVKSVEEDFLRELEDMRKAEKSPEKAEKKAARILQAVENIKAQSKL